MYTVPAPDTSASTWLRASSCPGTLLEQLGINLAARIALSICWAFLEYVGINLATCVIQNLSTVHLLGRHGVNLGCTRQLGICNVRSSSPTASTCLRAKPIRTHTGSLLLLYRRGPSTFPHTTFPHATFLQAILEFPCTPFNHISVYTSRTAEKAICTQVCVYVCLSVCLSVCMYACVHACMYVCMCM